VYHFPDRDPFHDTRSAGRPPCAANWRTPVRGFSCNGRRGGGDRLRCGAAWSWGGARTVGPGSGGAARDGSALSGRAWASQTTDAYAAFPAGRCIDRNRGGLALQGFGCGGGRNPGRSAGGALYRDEAAGIESRVGWCALLADPASRHRKSQRSARPLAHRAAALKRQPGRSERSGRSALAGGTLPVARRTARSMGGQP
jgi:hypothetical protein